MRIEGTVADVVSSYKIVVNIGSEDGVAESHRYGIYSKSEPIEDPETGEDLGRIEYKIAEVKPDVIKEDHTIMKTDEMVGGLKIPKPNFKPRPKKLSSNPEFEHGSGDVQKGDSVKFLEDTGGD
jgi:hypothetical protein